MLEDDKKPAEVESKPSEDVWNALKKRAADLMDSLDEKDYAAVTVVIENLNELRDNTLYLEVGKLTRSLHDAIVNFDISPDGDKTGSASEESESQMANAKDRLDYVINLTQSSADKTMDMVEEGIPIVSELGADAKALRSDWGRLIRREMQPDEFRDLAQRLDGFLERSVSGNESINQKLNEILLAQDFQDLTGQVIKKVISLVQNVEDRLVELMRVAGQIEELTGVVKPSENESETKQQGLGSVPEGPQIHAEAREDVVSGQDDVDDLLSSLGF
ncbi:MAG: chemotaxis protein CheZ [Pseudohongiellaceae bacterium]|jgi:chemotaxis protein CheZ